MILESPLESVIKFLKQVDDLKTAENLLDSFSKYANNLQQIDEIAKLYHEIKSYEKSAKFAELSLKNVINEQQAFSARSNLAKIYNHLNEPYKALANIYKNLEIVAEHSKESYEMKMEEIFSIYLTGKHDVCEEKLRNLLEDIYIPEYIKDRIYFNLGTYEMEKGEFKKGFEKFTKYGRKVDVFKKIQPPANIEEWDGTIVEGKKILVLHRGGIGDELINVRFMKTLKEKGLDPIWQTSFKHLIPVFNRNGFKTVEKFEEIPNILDYQYCSSMDLPYLLALEKCDLGTNPYIIPDPAYVKKWSDRINGGIGIKWSGNPYYEHDLHRSLSLNDIMSVVGNSGKTIVSLQKDGFQGIELFPDVVDLHDELNTIEDTLAIISLLDFVITSCTSIAHMAASMGKKVFVLPPISCYYVWLGRNDGKSDWYNNNCTVIRQTVWNSWQEPLEKLKKLIENE